MSASLFNDVNISPAAGDPFSLSQEMFKRILQAANARGLSKDGPWSLGELGVDEGDFEKLQQWGRSLPPSLLEANDSPYTEVSLTDGQKNHYTRKAVIGTLLLLVLAEAARRHATGGNLWPKVAQEGPFIGQTKAYLFNRYNIPQTPLLTLVGAACSNLGLRNAFPRDSAEISGKHINYSTVFLQIGFSEPGVKENLADWLRSRRPLWDSIERLLDKEDKLLFSKTFSDLWELLQRIARGQIDQRTALGKLEAAGWIRPGFCEQLYQFAGRLRLHDRPSSVAPDLATEPEPTEPTTEWRWDAPDDIPSPVLRLDFLDTLVQSESWMLSLHDGPHRPLLWRNGGYHIDLGGFYKREIGLQRCLTFPVTVWRRAGDTEEPSPAYQWQIDLWSAGDAFLLLERLDSSRVKILSPEDAEQSLPTSGCCGLIVRNDLQVYCGSELLKGDPFSDGLTFHRLEPGTGLRVCADGTEWYCLGAGETPTSKNLRKAVKIASATTVENDLLELKIRHPPDVQISYVWCCGEDLPHDDGGTNDSTVAYIGARAIRDPALITAYIGLRHGDQPLRPVRRCALSPLGGIFRIKPGECRRAAETDDVFAWEFQSTQARLRIPEQWGSNELLLFCGWRCLGPARFPAARAKLAEGSFGGRLYLLGANGEIPLAAALLHGGWLKPRSGQYDERQRVLRMELALRRYAVLVGKDRLVVWCRDGKARHTAVGRVNGMSIESDCDRWAANFRAASLWREGRCLGTAWSKDWHEGLHELPVEQTALLVRWARLPVLTQDAMENVQRAACAQPEIFIPAWGLADELVAAGDGDDDLCCDLSYADEEIDGTNTWAAVPVVFRKCDPRGWTLDQCRELVKRLAGEAMTSGNNVRAVRKALQRVLELDPLLYRRCAERFSRPQSRLEVDHRQVRNSLSFARWRLQPNQKPDDDDEVAKVRQELRQELTALLRSPDVAERWIKNLLESVAPVLSRQAGERQERTVHALLCTRAGRDLVGRYLTTKDFDRPF